MITWENIQLWKSSALDATVDNLIAERRNAQRIAEELQALLTKAENWEGEARKAAGDTLQNLYNKALYSLTCIGEVLNATSVAQDGISAVELAVNEAKSRADTYGFIISPSGSSVQDPNPVHELAQTLERQMHLRTCAKEVSAALAKARETDDNYVNALNRVSNGQVKVTEDLDDTPGLPDFPPPGASPKEVATWWAALSDSEKDAILANDVLFHQLGNMNGIPASVRHQANFDALKSRKERAQAIVDDFNKRKEASLFPWLVSPSEEEKRALSDLKEIDQLRQSLNMSEEEFKNTQSLRTIEEINEAHANRGNNDRSLLVYEPATGEEGYTKTHAAVAVGDVDTATHVTTLVPGLNTNVEDNIVGYTNQMQQLQDRTEAMLAENNRGHETVATIAWQAYDTPGFQEVIHPDLARVGGDKLRDFIEGYTDARNAQGNPRAHTSVIGHSYGSTTASSGMLDIRPGIVDDFTMIGSPGYDSQSIHRFWPSGSPISPQAGSWDFNVPKGHVYAMRYDNDIINAAEGVLGIDPMDDPHIKHPEVGESSYTRKFGIIEALLPPLLNDIFELKSRFSSHGEYLEQGTRANEHLARITGDLQP